jgi:hypothetical protein
VPRYCNPDTIETLLPEVNKKLKKLELKKEQIAELDGRQSNNRICVKSSATRFVRIQCH